MSDLSDLKLPDVKALVAFGKVGIEILSSRMLSVLALFGVVALSAYVAYSPSLYGAVVVGIVAVCVFVPALKAETKRQSEANSGKEAP